MRTMSATHIGDNTLFRLHVTDTQTFDSCKRKWYLGSLLHCNLGTRFPKPSLFLGTGIHLALEAYAGALIRGYSRDEALEFALDNFFGWAQMEIGRVNDEVGGLDEDDETKLRDSQRLGLGMLKHYAPWDAWHEVTYVSAEQKFEVPLTQDILLCGRIDGMVEVAGELWVIDHKTTSRIDADGLVLDSQGKAYLLAARQLYGPNVKGIIYNFLRKKVPAVPELLKKGGLTRRKDIDTTWDVYHQAIVSNGLDPNDYQDMHDLLTVKENPFFRRELVKHTDAQLDQTISQMVSTAKEMHATIRTRQYRPTTDLEICRRCSFKPVSESMARGENWKFILKTEYKKKAEHRAKIEWED